MKRQVRKPNRSKKAAKVRRSSSAAHASVGQWVPIPNEPLKHRPYPERQWEPSDLLSLLSLGLEPDDVAPKVNRRKGEARLAEPAALPVADPVGGEHPALGVFTLAKLAKIVDDVAMLHQRDRVLLLALDARYTELEARVAVAESRLDSLLHNKTQVSNLDKSGIPTGTPLASYAYTPFYEVSRDLPANLPGGSNCPLPKEFTNSVPSVPAPSEGEGTGGVPLGEETCDPQCERLRARYGWPRCVLFKGDCALAEPSRFTRFMRKCVAQARRLLHAAARRITEFDPPH